MKNKTGKFIAVFSAFLLAEGSTLCGTTIPVFAAENTTVNVTADSIENTQGVLPAADTSAAGGVAGSTNSTGVEGPLAVAGTDSAVNASGATVSAGETTDGAATAAQASAGTQTGGTAAAGTTADTTTAVAAGTGSDSTAADAAAGTATAAGIAGPAAATTDAAPADSANAAVDDPTAAAAEAGTVSTETGTDAAAANAAALAAAQAAAEAAADPNVTNTNVVGANGWTGHVLTRSRGINYGPSGKETYYNLNMSRIVALMHKLGYEGDYWIRDDGVKMLGQYILCAANFKKHKRGSIIETSLGTAIVADTGAFSRYGVEVDIAVTW